MKAAGSLKAAFTALFIRFEAETGTEIAAEFGPSGLLRDGILGGQPTDVFASANMEHPEAVAAEKGGEVCPFARNALCALVQPDADVTSETLLDRMLSTNVRVGISTPKADPSGDYAFALFERAEALRPGAASALKAKALQLTGGPGSPEPPAGRTVYSRVMEDGRADVFLTYRTNAGLAAREVPGLAIVEIPEALAVGADYGLVVLSRLPEAAALAGFILSPDGQAILARYGFAAPRTDAGTPSE